MTEVSTSDCQSGWLSVCRRGHVLSEMPVYKSPSQIIVHVDAQLHNLWSACRQSLCLSVFTLCLTIEETHSRFGLPIVFQWWLSSAKVSCETTSVRIIQCPIRPWTNNALYALIKNIVIQRYLAAGAEHAVTNLRSESQFSIETSVPNAICHLRVASNEDLVDTSRMLMSDLRSNHVRRYPEHLPFRY